MKGHKRFANLYVLQGSTVTSDVVVTTSSLSDENVTRLLHKGLGHMSENGMTALSMRGLIDGQSTSKLKFCEHCIFGSRKESNSPEVFTIQREDLIIYIMISGVHLRYLLKEVLIIC